MLGKVTDNIFNKTRQAYTLRGMLKPAGYFYWGL